jgi:hypothetical protein
MASVTLHVQDNDVDGSCGRATEHIRSMLKVHLKNILMRFI